MKRLVIVFGVLLFFCVTIGQAANRVDISNCCGDSILVARDFNFKIAIENDVIWKKMSLGFKIWSPDGAMWHWVNKGPTGFGTSKVVAMNTDSRMYPPGTVWDGGFHIFEYDLDGISPDAILLTGDAIAGGLPIGPAQDMMYLNLHCVGYDGKTICIDSTKLGPTGDWVFTDDQQNSSPPEIGWTQGGICWPITRSCNDAPSIISSGHIDAYHCAPGNLNMTAFDNELDIIHWQYEPLSGLGTFSLSSTTGTANTITYTPAPDEMSGSASVSIDVYDEFTCGHCCENWRDTILVEFHSIGDANNDNAINVGDAVYLINYVFKSGPAPHAWKAGDANCDGAVNVGDAVRLINHVFKGAPSPVNACCL